MSENIYVPISDKAKHPIFIGAQHNPSMGAYDVCLMVGNFKTKAKASEFADRLADFMRDFESVTLDKAQ